ncbi:MAG: GNAT family N-acetyltransferase [Solirubrobacteraceae bacterium]|nr:GNAT family N-acetyltransferase [Solirubrobacteraceae bacterium]
MSGVPETWVAEPAEAETVARLLVGFRDHLGKDWPSDNAFLAGVEKLIEDRDTVFVIGSPDPDAPPAGVVALRFRHSLWTASPDCLLEDVYVEEHARGTGLGRALVERALEVARERGARRAELDVNETNEAAMRLYVSLGFGRKATPWEGRDLFLNVRLDDG